MVVNIIAEVPEDAVSVEVTGIGFEHEVGLGIWRSYSVCCVT